MGAVNGEYTAFFRNTMCYAGQGNINGYVVERGAEDLKEQLRRTGHEDMITHRYEALWQIRQLILAEPVSRCYLWSY